MSTDDLVRNLGEQLKRAEARATEAEVRVRDLEDQILEISYMLAEAGYNKHATLRADLQDALADAEKEP